MYQQIIASEQVHPQLYSSTIVSNIYFDEIVHFEMLVYVAVNCGDPVFPTTGILGNYNHTREGATVTFQCDPGYYPSAVITFTCTYQSEWMPIPRCTEILSERAISSVFK